MKPKVKRKSKENIFPAKDYSYFLKNNLTLKSEPTNVNGGFKASVTILPIP